MKQTKMRNKDPLCFKSRSLTDIKINNIKEELKVKDWNGILRNDDMNMNVEYFCSELESTMDKYAPVREVCISWKRKYTDPWMNKSIEQASEKCRSLYKKRISHGASKEDSQSYKNYRNTYNKIKLTVQNEFYATKCT